MGRRGLLAMGPVLGGMLVVPWSRHLSGWMPANDAGAFVPMVVLTLMAGVMVVGSGGGKGGVRGLSVAIRAASRMMPCMIPLGIAVLTVVMVAGSGDFLAIAQRQAAGGYLWLAFQDPFCASACVLFFLANTSCLRAMRGWSDNDVMAHGMALVFCAVQAALWLGAWYDPFGGIAQLEKASQPNAFEFSIGLAFAADMVGLAVFAAKVAFLMAVQRFVAGVWVERDVRGVFQRVLPWSLGILLAEGAYLWLAAPLGDVQTAIQWVLAVVGWVGVVWLAGVMLWSERPSARLSARG